MIKMQILKDLIKGSVKKEPELDKTTIPKHIAVIMDGNRRWAKSRNLPSFVGHKKGADVLINTVKDCLELEVKVLTVFAFSTENWNRSVKEIEHLMNLFELYLRKQASFMKKEGVRLSYIGDLSEFSEKVQNAFAKTIEITKDGKNLDLVIAINYGSRDEMKRAVVKIVEDCADNKISKEDISEKLISNYLDTKKFNDPDLLIRTSGEKRLSNFLLWQSSYSELYITDLLWPEFTKKDLHVAIHEYQKRKKRRLKGA